MAHDAPSTDSIMLWPDDPPHASPDSNFAPWLDVFPVKSDTPRGMVLIFPGGAYRCRAVYEGEPVAREFNRMGLNAAVVQYRVSPHRHPAPLLDAARAIQIVRNHAVEWNVVSENIAVCGFSAGGQLSASIGVHFDADVIRHNDVIGTANVRPDALVLCYPVITTSDYAHRGSFKNLLGDPPPETMKEFMTLENHVSERTPPAFLWHTVEDATVPIENSLKFIAAYRRYSIPFEFHAFPNGRHGMGLAPEDSHVASWIRLCEGFLKLMDWV